MRQGSFAIDAFKRRRELDCEQQAVQNRSDDQARERERESGVVERSLPKVCIGPREPIPTKR